MKGGPTDFRAFQSSKVPQATKWNRFFSSGKRVSDIGKLLHLHLQSRHALWRPERVDRSLSQTLRHLNCGNPLGVSKMSIDRVSGKQHRREISRPQKNYAIKLLLGRGVHIFSKIQRIIWFSYSWDGFKSPDRESTVPKYSE